MSLEERIKKLVTKLQSLPEFKKMIIFWSVIVVVSGIMLYFWVISVEKRISYLDINNSLSKLPISKIGDRIDEQFRKLPQQSQGFMDKLGQKINEANSLSATSSQNFSSITNQNQNTTATQNFNSTQTQK